jgi:class 3 adenylate cyclase
MIDSAQRQGRALAAVLFTDIVASTALRTELGEDAGDELRRAHDRIVDEATRAHGGTVVKGLGDGAMAVFGGASEAVEAAVAVQQGAERLRRQQGTPAPLQLRIGISVGEVVWENGDCFGTPVIEASRLCASASEGQILGSDLVRALTVGRLGSLFTPVGALDLKGLAKPLETVEVFWRRQAEETIAPLPKALEGGGRLPLADRAPEREFLLSEWKRATSEQVRGQARAVGARIVLVSGEPGIGKTRLVREVAADLHRNGAVVLFGQCVEEMGASFHPFIEALTEIVEACADDQLRSLMGPLSGELTALVPTLRSRMPGLAEPLHADQGAGHYRLFEGVVDLLAAMSATAPVLLVLDDLQWADAPTLLLLRHLLRSNEPMRLLVAGTYRDTDIGRAHLLTELLPDLRRSNRGKRLPLSGLDPEGVAEMVASAADRKLNPDEFEFAHHLQAETGGHPFCVEEMLLHFVETGILQRQGGRWMVSRVWAELGIPEGVREVVLQRLARLPAACLDVLEAAAVIGQQFDVRLLASVVEGGMPVVVGALEAAERVRLIRPVPGSAHRYDFAHKLIRSGIYEDVPTSRRRWLHRDVALALEQRDDGGEQLNELAFHFGEAAAVGEAERAVDYARRAGDKAVEMQAFEVAAGHYARARAALEMSGQDQALACDLLLCEAASLSRAGRDDFRTLAFAAADAARDQGDAIRLASAALLFVHFGPVYPVVNHREVALIEEALDRLDKADSPARARLLAGLGAALTASGAQPTVALSLQAVAMARRLGDPMVLAQVLISHYTAIAGLDTDDESLLVARELVMLGEQLGDSETSFVGHIYRYASLVRAGLIDEADAALDTADALARELRQPIYAFHVLRLRTGQALLAGRIAEGEQLAEATWQKGLETAIPGQFLDAMLVGFRLPAREQQGRLADMEAEVSWLADSQPDWLMPQVVRARLQCLSGRKIRVRAFFDQLKADGFRSIPRNQLWFETVIQLSAIAHALSDAEAAATLYEMLSPYAGRTTWTPLGSFGPADRALAVLATTLARYDDAERHFMAADELCSRLRAPGWAACVRIDWAKMLRSGEPGDTSRSLTLVARALADAETLGLAGLADELRDLAR